MKGKLCKAIAIIVLVAACITILADFAMAEEENKFVNFLKKIFIYPFSVTKKSTEVVADTTKKSGEMLIKTGDATAGVITGKPERFPDLIVEPVKGSGETAVTAIEGAVKMPVEAAEEIE